MKQLIQSRPLLWVLLALPGVWMIWRWSWGVSTYGEIVSEAGVVATQLLLAALAVTPLRLIFRRGSWLIWLMRRRRDIGLAAFGYAAGHLIVYVLRKRDPTLMLEEGLEPWLLSGWVALTLLLVLAATSNDASVRFLKRGWKRLHRLVYPATVLVFVHWILSAFDPTTAYIYLAVIGGLEVIRIGLQWRQRVT
ncbi:MAG: ferric reductase-like transmembrane domain-containing protein [Devosia sp.]